MNALAKIEFWFDFASTYSYPAAMRVEELAGSQGCIVQWRPFLLSAIFQKQGWNDSPFNIYAAKGRYMWRDLERLCASLEIPFRKPSQFPRNGLMAARVACANAGAAWIGLFVRRVYEAISRTTWTSRNRAFWSIAWIVWSRIRRRSSLRRAVMKPKLACGATPSGPSIWESLARR